VLVTQKEVSPFIVLCQSSLLCETELSRHRRTQKDTIMAISNAEIKVAPEVSQFIAQPRKLLIDGQWVVAASGKTFPVYNPATGEVMAQVAEGEKEDIDRAVRAARKAFEKCKS